MQLEFPYASLDFPGRTTVKVHEIATRTGYSEQHILNLIDQGLLVAIDAKSAFTSRRCIRIPIEEYRTWVMKNITGPASTRNEFLAQLPKTVLRELKSEIDRLLSAA